MWSLSIVGVLNSEKGLPFTSQTPPFTSCKHKSKLQGSYIGIPLQWTDKSVLLATLIEGMMLSFVKVLVTRGYTVSVQAYLNLILTCYISLRYLFVALTVTFKDTNLSYQTLNQPLLNFRIKYLNLKPSFLAYHLMILWTLIHLLAQAC